MGISQLNKCLNTQYLEKHGEKIEVIHHIDANGHIEKISIRFIMQPKLLKMKMLLEKCHIHHLSGSILISLAPEELCDMF